MNQPINLNFLPELEKALDALKCNVGFGTWIKQETSYAPILEHFSTLILAARAYEAQRQRAEEWRKAIQPMLDFEMGVCIDDSNPLAKKWNKISQTLAEFQDEIEAALTAHSTLKDKEV